MNNENNNNNGTVLGIVNPNPVPSPEPQNGTENLGNVVNPTPNVVDNGVVNPVSPIMPETLEAPTNPVSPVPPVNPEPNIDLNNSGVINENVNAPVEPIPVNSPDTPPITPQVTPTIESSVVPPVSAPVPPTVEPPMPPQPTPAFTNPQMVNMNQPNGFESPNNIGSNPPMSYEPEKTPKKKNKIMFIILILVILAFVGLGTYYVLNYTNLLNNKTNNVEITTKNLEVNIGDELSTNINDYAIVRNYNIQNCSLNTTDVNTENTGVYEYTINCNGISKSGKITIVDNLELKISLKEVYKAKGETLEASEFTDDSDLKLEFVSSSDVETYLSSNPGIYTIKLKATKNDKSNEVEGNLIILEYPLKGFYTCMGKEENVPDSKAKMTVGDMFTIINGENVVNGYGKVAYEVHTFDYKDATDEFDELVTKYNNDGTLTINNVTGNVTIDAENKTITIKSELKNEDVIAKYGEDNIKDYASIRDYYNKLNSQNAGSYTCKYEKSN